VSTPRRFNPCCRGSASRGFASPAGAVSEIGSGWYKVAGNATDSGTLGPLLLHATASGADPVDDCFPVVSYNMQDAVHLGLSAIPNTACTTNASLITSGTGTDQLSVSSGKVLLQATQTGVTIPTVTTVTNQLTAAAIATGVWQDTTAGDFTVASSIGKSLYTSGNAPGAASGLALVGSNMGTVASVTGAVGSVTAPVTVGTNNDKTGYSLTQAFPANFSSLGIGATGHISNVDTLTTYTGNTPQTGDAYARLGAPTGASVSADIAAVKSSVGSPMQAGSAVALSSTGLDAVAVETGLNARQALSIIASSAAGVLAGAATTSVTIAAAGVAATNRISATVDSSGNRSSVTLSPPA